MVIQLGLSDPTVYRLGLDNWMSGKNISQALVMYKGDNHRSFEFGAKFTPYIFLITTQAKRNLSSRSGIGGVRSAT